MGSLLITGYREMCPKLCLPINLMVPGWHPHVEMVSGMSVHFRSYPAPKAWHLRPIGSALRLRKQHLILLHFQFICIRFPEAAYHFLNLPNSSLCFCLCPEHSVHLEYSPSSWNCLIKFSWLFKVHILLETFPTWDTLYWPWNSAGTF